MKPNRLSRFYKGKKILIPGGAGFIGSNLAKRLVSYGAKVTVVDSFSRYCGTNSFNLIGVRGRIILVRSRAEEFIGKMRASDYGTIFNCVGLTNHHIGLDDVGLDYNVNCYGGLKILQRLRAIGWTGRMISIGSRSQYGKTSSARISESHPFDPVDIQTAHKIVFENYNKIFAYQFGMDLTFVRLTNVYGPGQRLKGGGIGAIGEIIRNALTGDEIVIYGDTRRGKDILFIDDVVDALLLLGAQKKTGFMVYNLGGQRHRLSELIYAIKKKISMIIIRIVPFPERVKKIDTSDVTLDIRKIQKDTGWEPRVSLSEGVAKTLEYYGRYKRNYL